MIHTKTLPHRYPMVRQSSHGIFHGVCTPWGRVYIPDLLYTPHCNPAGYPMGRQRDTNNAMGLPYGSIYPMGYPMGCRVKLSEIKIIMRRTACRISIIPMGYPVGYPMGNLFNAVLQGASHWKSPWGGWHIMGYAVGCNTPCCHGVFNYYVIHTIRVHIARLPL